MQQIAELSALGAGVAEVSADVKANKKQKLDNAAPKAAETEVKKKKQEVEDAVERAQLLSLLMVPCLAGVKPPADFIGLTKPQLVNLIKYY